MDLAPTSQISQLPLTEQKLAKLLASGVAQDAAAAAVGLSPSRVSQIASQKTFSDAVASLKYETLQAATNRDAKYDALEDVVLNQLERSIPMMFKSGELLNAMTRINQAKRRGAGADIASRAASGQIVNILMPTTIIKKFTTNINNQVVRAGDQDLTTIPSQTLQVLYDEQSSRTQGIESTGTETSPDRSEQGSGSSIA